MKTIEGDLIKLALEGQFDVIVHGCNCFHTMGGGIAAQIRRKFPEAYDADLQTIYGDKDKLGTFSSAFAKTETGVDFLIVNAYTQFKYGSGLHFDYDAFEKVCKRLKERFKGQRIGLPMIGAGLAGGDWNEIVSIIETELNGMDVTVVKFK